MNRLFQLTGASSLAILILVASVLAGCGGGDSAGANPAATSKAASEPAGG